MWLKRIAVVLGIALFLAFIIMPKTYADSELKINKYPVNIEDILKENTQVKITQELSLEVMDVEYITKYNENENLPKGTIQTVQEGRLGIQRAMTVRSYENDVLTKEEIVVNDITKIAIDKIVEIGTGRGHNNYKVQEGDTCFVTANTLSVRLEPDLNSEKVGGLPKNTKVYVVEVSGDWCYVRSSISDGFVDSGGLTNIDPNAENIDSYSEYSASQLQARLGFDMDMNEPSDFSIEQFKQVLENDNYDKHEIFTDNAEYFYYAERQYDINGIFLAAIAIHESAWGTSKIANDKNNLFGYGAVDSNPYGGAKQFDTVEEGIDLVARVLKKYYLNPAGTSIYGGDIASGKFYNGNTISAVNKIYASDKNWANGVYKWMTYLYNKL